MAKFVIHMTYNLPAHINIATYVRTSVPLKSSVILLWPDVSLHESITFHKFFFQPIEYKYVSV